MMWRAALMRSWGRLLGGLAALGLLLALAGPQAAAAGVARLDVIDVNTANYPAVKVTFSVADQDGQPITGLDQHTLKVVENGQEQAVTSAYALRNSPTPLSVMLAFDTSASMKDAGKFEQAKAAAKAFIAQMRPIDRLGLVQFDSAVAVAAPFSGDRGMLSKKVDGLTAQGNTRLYDALYLAINEVARVDGSKAVVLLTDGQDTESAADLGQVLALTRDRGVRVYAIGVGAEIDERVLGQLAQASGGAFYRAPTANDIAYAFRAMSNQLRNRYEISYNSPASAAQGATVEVKVLADTSSGQLTGLGSYLAPAYTPRARSSDTIGGQLQAVGTAPARSPISNSLIYASSLLAVLGILLISSGQALSRSLLARRERLRHFVSRGHATREAEAGDSLLGVVVVGVFRLLARISTRLLPPSHVRRLSHSLVVAGNPFSWRVSHFVTCKAIMALVLSFLGVVLFLRPAHLLLGLSLIAVLGVLGFYLPNVWLGMRIRGRQKEILKALPDALDLLTISVEAGLGLDGALLEVVNKWDNALADEFAVVLAELKMGKRRRDALRSLAYRTGVQEVSTFASALVQADELGMGIARPLAVQAEQMRVKRRQRAEKLAHEAAVKMIIPMALFILPSMFIVILGPAIGQALAVFHR